MIFLFSVSAHAGPKEERCTLGVLRELIEPLRPGIMNAQDRVLVQSWFSDPKLKPGEPEKKAFDLYLQRRMDLLDPELQQKVRAIIEKNEDPYIEGNRINGEYKNVLQYYSVTNPKEFRETAIYYHTLVHEIEHAIQDAHSGDIEVKFIKVLTKKVKIKERFREEYGAMLAEWNYIRSIPKEVRFKLFEELENFKGLPRRQKEMALRTLTQADDTALEYLRHEWGAGRYNMEQLEMHYSPHDQFIKNRNRNTTLGVGGVLLGGVGLYSVCAGLSSMRNSEVNSSTFYQTICQTMFRFPSVPSSQN